jgi:hypothetical protein
MVVASAGLHLFVVVVLPPETTLADQPTLNQQVEGTVDRRARNLALFDLHPGQKIIRVEVLVGGEDLVQERQTFLGDFEVVFPQISLPQSKVTSMRGCVKREKRFFWVPVEGCGSSVFEV